MKIINYIITTIKYAFIGVGWGTLIHYITTILINKGFYPTVPSFAHKFDNLSNAVGVQLLLFAILGILQGYSSYIFRKENISLSARTIAHFFLILVPLWIVGIILHWFSFSKTSMIIFFLTFTILYIIFYTLTYINEKRKIELINKKLNN